MLKFIKKFFKMIFILILIIFFTALGYYQYQKMKASGSLDKLLGNKNNSNSSSISSQENNKSDTTSNKDSSNDSSSSSTSGESLIKNNNYDEYYNKFNFDNVILLYEGKQESSTIKELLDRLIKNADDPLYTKPSVSFQNINGLSNNTITSENLEEYKMNLDNAKNLLGNNTYTVSFEYNKIKAMVNKIIITKN